LTKHDDVIIPMLRVARALVLHWVPDLLGPALRGVTWNRFPISKFFWYIQTLHLCGD